MMLNRVSLNTIGLNRIGLNRIGKPSRASSERPYIDPEVLASLKAVCICYGKSNDDPDRAVVKNLVDPDNPFVISNAAYEGMSGYNGYPVVFGKNKTWTSKSNGYVTSITSNTIHITNVLNAGLSLLYSYVKINGNLQNIKEIPPFKIEIKGLEGRSKFIYKYLATSDATKETNLYLENGTHELPKSFLPTEALIKDTAIGFSISPIEEGVTNFLSNITIKVLPEYEGAFVTDGIDDLITSTKTVQEMLGGSNELTIVSMVHQVKDSANNVSFTNYIRGSANGYFRNIVNNYDKTGIYGYTSSDLKGLSVVNNILGDKNDYTSNGDNRDSIINGNFNVQGYSYNDGNNTGDFSSVAWYWTIIANKVLTTDQINQVIAYFNLDRTLNPDILCDVKKQGITNENHAEFGDKLIDFSGNGRDIQLNNLAWDGDSGIGKYNYPNWKVNVTQGNKYARIVYYDSINGTYSANFKGITDFYKSYGLLIEIRVNRANTIDFHSIKEDGIYTITPPDDTTSMDIRFGGENVYNASCDITITQIPSHAGALCFDGVDDFGQFVGNLTLKDYTFIADRAYNRIALEQAPFIASKSTNAQAPFLMEYLNSDNYVYPHSFGATTKTINLNIQRQISYQSTYVYNGNSISKGTSVDTGDGLTIGNSGSTGEQYSPLCLWSLILFPYSMSEFLIERQLKKHKLGTLYPDMVEFRPIVKSNLPYSSISYSVNPGEYISVDSMVTITVTLPNTSDKLMEVSCNAISDISIYGDNGVYEITGKVVKSPQKINLVISSYLTMLSNSTLISNETLIKNE